MWVASRIVVAVDCLNKSSRLLALCPGLRGEEAYARDKLVAVEVNRLGAWSDSWLKKAPELDDMAWESWRVTVSSVWLCWGGLRGMIHPAGDLPEELQGYLRDRLYLSVTPTTTQICEASGESAAESSS
jgi:hypothetical protein